MLRTLSIRDVVLIDELEIQFDAGLCALTGETGAGKSILLDALGLALGARADANLVRHNAQQAVVAATFDVDRDPDLVDLFDAHAISLDDGYLVLRRILGADGRSRAFVNDQPVSVGLLRNIGSALVEIHGQFESHGLLDPASHLQTLDAFAGNQRQCSAVESAYNSTLAARATLETAEAEFAESRAREIELRAAVDELDALDPQRGEENRLASQRELMQHAEQLLDALDTAVTSLSNEKTDGGRGADQGIQWALRSLEKVSVKAGGRFDEAIAALERSAAELADAVHVLNAAARDIDSDPDALEAAEERLFALRATARKYDVGVDDLADLRDDMTRRLDTIAEGGDRLAELAQSYETARRAYTAAAEQLSETRRKAARNLDDRVAKELPPLRLDKATFETWIEQAAESSWNASGIDRVEFVIATNPGSAPEPLRKIASGGELSRFMLALKVVLSTTGGADVLVFDEVDAGIGGATAAAVGARLARLGESDRRQVLVVTHSPQVAAIAATHWRVSKRSDGPDESAPTLTCVDILDTATRREEIARMLAGATVTDEARAAAARLIDGDVTATPARAAG